MPIDVILLEDTIMQSFRRIHKRQSKYKPNQTLEPPLMSNRKNAVRSVMLRDIHQLTRKDTHVVFYGYRLDLDMGGIHVRGFWTYGSVIKRIWAIDKHEVIPVPKWVLMKASMVAYDRLSKLLDLDDK